ncbi:unnamed protein product [Mytilus edulis]|uniref:EGF-like domain-containing protein n=1 Tax=Mytilus edulis TaxID=6550 RepID=A0A8S3PYU8_MYTED|nr:unnamed protein product [Mytilus edulis]
MCYNGETWQRLNESNRCVCAVGFLGKQCEYSDGKDTNFMAIFHEGRSHAISPRPVPRILIASEITARISVLYFNNNKNQSITIEKGNTEHDLSNSVIPSDGIHLAGVELQSAVRINVYGFLYKDRRSEGFLLMPVKFASTKYIIPTLPIYIDTFDEKNLLALSPVYQNTAVNINLKLKSGSITFQNKQYRDNDTIRIVINKYNTLQLSHTSDLSGTMVTASKQVIVISGNQCNYAVSANIHVGYCQTFIESVLPTDQLDKMFITPHISTRLNNTVRIQAVNDTKLTINIENRKISKSLNARDYWDIYYNTTAFIFASDDILVISYPHGLPGGKGDPFMMTIPGINQYLYEYDFQYQQDFTAT